MKIHALILVLIFVLALSTPVLAGGKAVAATTALARSSAKALPFGKVLTAYQAIDHLKSVVAVLVEVAKRGPPPNLVSRIDGTGLGCFLALAAYFFLVDPPTVHLSPQDDFIDQQFQPPPSFRFPPELEVKPWE